MEKFLKSCSNTRIEFNARNVRVEIKHFLENQPGIGPWDINEKKDGPGF